MKSLPKLEALRRARMLAVATSLVAHLVIAAAAYVYVGWPTTPTITVIPVEVVAAPAGPGIGGAGEPSHAGATPANNGPIEDPETSLAKPSISADVEEARSAQPVERSTEATAETATNPSEPLPPTLDVAAKATPSAVPPPVEQVSVPVIKAEPPAREWAAATLLDARAVAPSPRRGATKPPPISEAEFDFVAPTVVASPTSIWTIPTQRAEHTNPSPVHAAPAPLESASAITPQAVVTSTPPPSPPMPDLEVIRQSLLPLARPSRAKLASLATANPTPPTRVDALPPPRLPRPRPVLEIATKTVTQPPLISQATTPPGQNLRQAATESLPAASTSASFEPTQPSPPASGGNVETAALKGSQTTVNPSSNPGVGVGAASGTALRPLPGNPAPRYPRLARERGWQGRVMIEVAVLNDGTVNNAEVEQSSGYRALDQAALRAVRRWRFAVADSNLPPHGAVVRVPITFKLSD